MNLKAILQKVVSWFKTEAKSVEAVAAVDVTALNSMLSARISQLEARANANSVAIATEQAARQAIDSAPAEPISPVFTAASLSVIDAATGAGYMLSKDGVFSITNSTTEVDMSNVNVAIQIALTLKANDPSLTDAVVQAATNAALAAAYPAPAPTPTA